MEYDFIDPYDGNLIIIQKLNDNCYVISKIINSTSKLYYQNNNCLNANQSKWGKYVNGAYYLSEISARKDISDYCNSFLKKSYKFENFSINVLPHKSNYVICLKNTRKFLYYTGHKIFLWKEWNYCHSLIKKYPSFASACLKLDNINKTLLESGY